MDTQVLTTILFLSVVALTIGITFWASRQTKTAADFYSGGRSFSGFQNGLAIGGDYMSAASFLGISGAIAVYGYDGFLYSIGFLVAWLVALLLVAEMLRNAGRYTMADQLAFRMSQRPVRTAASVSTVVVSIFYLLAQMVGAGTLVALLLGVDSQAVQNITIIGVGALMIFYVVVGGMKGTTYVQIVKAVLLMIGSALIVVLVLVEFNFNLSSLLGAAAENSGKGEAFLAARSPVRREPDVEDRLPVPRPRPGARHRRPAAHPDPLLHRADRAGRAEVGAVGDRPDRRLLPDDAGPRLRCRGPARPRPGGPAPRAATRTSRHRSSPRPSVAARAPRAARSCWR